MLKIIIAESNEMLRSEIRSIIERSFNYVLIAETDDDKTTFQLTKIFIPEIIIMGCNILNKIDLNTIKQIKQNMPYVKILVISLYTDKALVQEMLKSGISGFIVKENIFADLNSAIHSIIKDETYLNVNF